MKVKIVGKKEDVKEMTIEELAKERLVGMLWRGQKCMLIKTGSGNNWGLFTLEDGLCGWSSCSGTKIQAIRLTQGQWYEWFIFDTACELYLWMAE